MSRMSKGLYIHIPFCLKKCGYCDFLSFDNMTMENEWAAYKDALICEIISTGQRFRPVDIQTIYIGGGTPTIWPGHFLSEILAVLPPAAEVTCEANPGTLTDEKISALVRGGVNRVSLGLQAWQPRLLKAISRAGTLESFQENYQALRSAGIGNISIDLMFALPGQSLEDWDETLEKVADLQPEHISAYALTPTDVDEETDRLMYHRCKTFLKERGYEQYELSNFCRPGFESKHNLKYWTLDPYIGLGLGAHSFENGVRWHNTTDIKKYISQKDIPNDIREGQVEADLSAERMILGLRMTKGVPPDEYYRPWIDKMKADGLLQEESNRIFLTDLGMDLANIAMAGFLNT